MSLAGHEEAWRTWRAALAGGRLHHGWLLTGRKGLGKANFALAAARALVSEGGSTATMPARHPDILLLTPLPATAEDEKKRDEGRPFQTKRNIAIDQVRAIQRRLTTRPTLGSHRAVIVDSADDLEKGAANALLKSLEEPPQGTIFLLLSHRPGRLAATIRSRCRALRFADIADAELDAILARDAPEMSREERGAAVAAAAGSPGAALDFVARGLAGTHRLMTRIAGEGDPGLGLRTALGAEAGARPDREQLAAVLETARRVLVAAAATADRERQGRIVEAHARVSALLAEAPTANFDAALLLLEIGGLLASVAPLRAGAG